MNYHIIINISYIESLLCENELRKVIGFVDLKLDSNLRVNAFEQNVNDLVGKLQDER